MKNFIIIVLIGATGIFAGLWIKQNNTSKQTEITVGELQHQVAELQASLQDQQKQTERLKGQLKDAHADLATEIKEAARLMTNQTTSPSAGASGPTNSKPSALAEMFSDPKMKEMIKAQQKTAISSMIAKNYARLFSDLHLTPEQTSALKDMIINKQLASSDLGMSMFTGDSDPSQTKDLAEKVKAANDASDAQIKDFLGADNFSQYQDYEKSMGERMTVSGFKDQLAGGATALTDDQEQQLVQQMKQQREGFKFTTDFADKSNLADLPSMLTEDRMNGYFQETEKLNAQYVAQAQGILGPDQLTAFKDYLDGQVAMQKAGMQMAAKMFAPAKASAQ